MTVPAGWNRVLVLAVAALLFAVVFFPVLSGARTFFVRDLGSTQLPAGDVFSEVGFSRINPHASFGQSYLLNPNLGVLFPFFKGARAANVQIVLFLYASFAGVFLFLHRRTEDVGSSIFGASAFSLSGYVLSSTSFLNAITVIGCGSIALATVDTLQVDRRALRWGAAISFVALMWLGGEPALAMILALSIASVVAGPGRSSWPLVALAGGTIVASPYWYHVAFNARDAYRLSTGFSAKEALSNSMHPLRLLESAVPKMFGDWDSIAANWWGFALTGDQLPYVACTAIGIPALVLFALSLGSRSGHRSIAALACGTFAASCAGSSATIIRFVSSLEPFPLRYPVKLHLATTLFVSIAAGMHLAAIRMGDPNPKERRLTFAALAFASMILFFTFSPSTAQTVGESFLWSPSWRTSPSAIPGLLSRASASGVFALSSLIAFILLRRTRSERLRTVYFAFVIMAIALSLKGMMPSAPVSLEISPFITAALDMDGRVMERAGKDLDPVRRGLYGTYANDDIRNLALVQRRQLWALAGSPRGIRYAFDRDPDGSYSWRMVRVTRHIDSLPWERRLAWLRQSAVTGVISYQRLPVDGYRPLAAEATIGVPAVIYAVKGSLSEARRVSCAIATNSLEESMKRLDEGIDDRSIVIEGPSISCSPESGVLEIIDDVPLRLSLVTDGPVPGWIFLTRPHTRQVRALVNGIIAPVFPANGAFVAIPVSAGQSSVTVTY